MKWVLDNSTKVLGILSFGLLMLSMVHDWAYFLVVGPKLRSIQTTYDYISNAIEWLPTVALFTVACFSVAPMVVFALGLVRGEHLFSERECGFEDQVIRRDKRADRRGTITLLITALIAFLFSLANPFPLNVGLVGFAGAAVVVGAVHDERFWMAKVALFVLATAFGWGILDGTKAIIGFTDVHRIMLKGGETKQVSLLRSFEKGLLVFNPSTDQVEFLRWEQIDRLGHPVGIDNEPSSCRLLGWLCDKPYLP